MLFVSPQKLFLFSRYLNFYLDFLVMQQNNLIRKIKLTSNFMTPQLGQQTIGIHILPSISRCKGNQTTKFSQLVEYKPYKKCCGEASLHGSGTISRKLKLTISLDQQSKVLYSLFLLYPQLRAIEIYRNYAADHLLLPHIKHI